MTAAGKFPLCTSVNLLLGDTKVIFNVECFVTLAILGTVLEDVEVDNDVIQ